MRHGLSVIPCPLAVHGPEAVALRFLPPILLTSSPKAPPPMADTVRETVNFARSRVFATRLLNEQRMSTKTNKRKRTAKAAEPVAAETAAAPTPAASEAAAPTIALASHCTVKDAADLRMQLLQLLEEPVSVVIDAASVERVDTAVMQLLCAFVRDRAERNLGVDWRGAPAALRDAAQLLGVAPMLALSAEAA